VIQVIIIETKFFLLIFDTKFLINVQKIVENFEFGAKFLYKLPDRVNVKI